MCHKSHNLCHRCAIFDQLNECNCDVFPVMLRQKVRSIRQGPYTSVHCSLLPARYISWSGLHWLPVKWCIDVPLFPMPFAVPFELNMFVPFELESHLRDGKIPCEVHFAVHLRLNGTHLKSLTLSSQKLNVCTYS